MTFRRAFSLTELLVVIAIIAVLAFGFPNFIRWVESAAVKGFANEFASALSYARDYARSHSVRVVVAVVDASAALPQNWTGDPDADPVLYLVFADANKNGEFDAGDQLVTYGKSDRIKVVKNELVYPCFGGTGRCVVFYPVGPPKIGAVNRSIEFQSTRVGDVVYGVKVMSITGIAQVYRR